MKRRPITRHLFVSLFLAAVAAPVGAYQESPMLAELVKAGKLPPVEERLPDKPVVTQPIRSIGKYGGTWRRMGISKWDTGLNSRIAYEPIVRWDRTGRKIVPGLAESWDIRDGGKTYVFHLRKGHKWSDGHPFTAEDLLFWYENILMNKDICPLPPSWLIARGQTMRVTAPDPLTAVFHFSRPNGLFLETLAFRGHQFIYPQHYLKQFHIKFTDPDKVRALAKKLIHNDLWFELFRQMCDPRQNPGRPVLSAWKLTTRPPAKRLLMERNPYYYKIDPAGNQLPYIDRVAMLVVQSGKMVNLKAMSGEVDFQMRWINSANFAVFQKYSRLNQKKNKKLRFRVLRDVSPSTTVIYLNQHSKDPEMRALLQDRRFRTALSMAINRKEIIEIIYDTMAQPSRGIASPYDPYYLPEFDAKYLKYDSDRANRLLDEVGLKRVRGGWRRQPSGKKLKIILNCYPSESGCGSELWQLVIEYWREVGLDVFMKTDAPTLSRMRVSNGDSDFWTYGAPGLHWVLDPQWYVPWTSRSYFAPLYGRYEQSGGTKGIEPSPEIQQMIDWYKELRWTVGNDARKLELGRSILRQWSDECYTIGIVHEENLVIVSERLKNVPDHIIHSWRVMTPGYIGIEQFYIDEE